MQDFKKIRAWHEAHRLRLAIHTSCDPERFRSHPGQRAQTLRCANSIASNISEGSAKDGAEFARYLKMSLGSTKELESHLMYARDAHLISERRFLWLNESVEHIRRMLINLIKAIQNDEGDTAR